MARDISIAPAVMRRRVLSPCSGFRSLRPLTVMLAAITVLTGPNSAQAANLDLLTRLLIPAFIAQNFAGLCKIDNPQFEDDLKLSWPTVAAFAEHLKIEVTSDLTPDDAIGIMTAAANVAKSEAEQQLLTLAKNETAEGAKKKILLWCGSSGREYVVRVIDEHVRKHATFDKIVKEAKEQ